MNNVFKLRTDNELLEWDGQPVVTSGNENVDVLQVEFGPEWEFPGARYFASFFIDSVFGRERQLTILLPLLRPAMPSQKAQVILPQW